MLKFLTKLNNFKFLKFYNLFSDYDYKIIIPLTSITIEDFYKIKNSIYPKKSLIMNLSSKITFGNKFHLFSGPHLYIFIPSINIFFNFINEFDFIRFKYNILIVNNSILHYNCALNKNTIFLFVLNCFYFLFLINLHIFLIINLLNLLKLYK